MWSPFGNETEFGNYTVAWRPSPLQRGTFDILSTCLTTMILCVWTTIHLNIPEYGMAKTAVWRKVKWVLLGVVIRKS